jgi:entericidin A
MMNRRLNTALLRPVALVALSGLLLGLAGCNTFNGMGQDLSATGRAISNAAK